MCDAEYLITELYGVTIRYIAREGIQRTVLTSCIPVEKLQRVADFLCSLLFLYCESLLRVWHIGAIKTDIADLDFQVCFRKVYLPQWLIKQLDN